MSYNSFGAPEWALTPVGKTALERVLARHLSVAITVENVIFAEPDPLSSSVGTDPGFAPRRVTVTTRSGRGDKNRIDLFFKIPREREVEAHVLGRRLGMQHQPRILVSSLDIQKNGVETKAFCYIYVPGRPLGDGADGNVFTTDSPPGDSRRRGPSPRLHRRTFRGLPQTGVPPDLTGADDRGGGYRRPSGVPRPAVRPGQRRGGGGYSAPRRRGSRRGGLTRHGGGAGGGPR
ncbi:hypothetical protein KAU45_01255 [bacterium]|nr:hypothetical protein [bacterium]